MKQIVWSLLMFSTVAFGGTLQCAGTVDKIGMHASNRVMLKLSSMNRAVFICSPSYDWTVTGTTYSTSPDMCKTLVSMLMHAKATGAEIGNMWFDGDAVPASCTTWEAWKSANIRHFMY